MVNLHFSLLPRWRGAAPVERAILEGDAETGVCLMAVEAGPGHRGIYAEAATAIGDEETADELRSRLVAIGCRLLDEHLAEGSGRSAPPPGPGGRRPPTPRRSSPASSSSTGTSPPLQIRRVIRVGRAWTTFRGRRLGVAGGGPGAGAEGGPGRNGAGARARSTEPRSIAGDGSRLRLVTVHPEGRRPMDAAEWIRGVRPGPTSVLGPGDRTDPPVGSRAMATPTHRPPMRVAPSILSADFGSLSEAVDSVAPGHHLAPRRRHGRALRPQPDHRAAGGGLPARPHRPVLRHPPDDHRPGQVPRGVP